MKQFLITVAGVFAGLLIFLIGVPFVLVVMAAGAASSSSTPQRAVLELDLRDSLSDQSPQNPFAGIGRRSASVMSVVEGLRRAQSDPKIKGLLIRLPEGGLEPGSADELRQAVLRFRASGKPVIAHSQGLYPSGVVTATYMLGTAADELWLQPGASFQVTGLSSQDLFLKRAFDRFGVKPQFEQRAEYKNAVNGYLYDDYTPAHREAQLSWMNSVYQSNLAAAASARKVDAAALRRTLEAGPYLAEEALSNRLVDRLGQVREAQVALMRRAGADAEIVEFEDYGPGRERGRAGAPSIALIEAEGAIVTGRDGGGNPFAGSSNIYSDDVAEAFYDAIKAKDVKAIVFRISSPGGSDTASEQILSAIRAAKAAGKPVVVSMGSYGASGGYWVATEASAIVAQPTTLTGSIGVFGGKFALGEALGRYGVDVRELNVGNPYAGAFSMGREFTPQERAAFARWMDNTYANFLTRVAVGRKLPPERVQQIARGHVWTGAQARELGLVDEVGGLYQAVDQAKRLANLSGEPRLRRMTPNASAFEALERMFGVSAASVRTLAAAAWIFGDPRASAIMDELAQARMRDGGALVLAPERFR
ncbi:signal peptide peptidase SppA [Phenylobacterium deserti]|uniref:Signal peptide peptidase SppA n=1 Tax=Phenylobacterium deserti TaxID=1914756 RepID=A0A328AW33_9CAUL|nr:signal peptide peptidase SppA [Phenylobacterium deserti]RAK57916.1 signal peptide peptidase SppA [Phenylobacterium deserti]